MNPESGVRYTMYSCSSIDSDLLHELLYVHGRDLTFEAALKEHMEVELAKFMEAADELAIARAESGQDRENPNIGEDDPDFDEEWVAEQFAVHYECDEAIIGGTYEGVTYQTTWLGGAQMLWVFESPLVQYFHLCSPCVPGACNGNEPTNNLDGHLGYAVPPTWLHVQDDGLDHEQRWEKHE